MIPRSFGLGLLAALVTHAQAQDAQLQTPDVFVTATRTPRSPSTILSDIRLIDEEEIAAAGVSTLTELLQSKAGLEVTANGGAGQASGVFIRGANTSHVVLLIDGVRVNSATTGMSAFEHLPLNQIERIEVLRGPGSSLYGADAIGGVIQIFTKRGGNRTSLSAGYGTYETERYTAGFARDLGATRFSVQLGYEETDSFSATNENVPFAAFVFNPDDDPYRNRNLGFNFSHEWAIGQELAVRVLVSEGEAHFDTGPGEDAINEQQLSSYALESRNKITSLWQSTVRVARGTDDAEFKGAFPAEFRTDQDQAVWQNDIAALAGQIVAGLEYRREKIDASIPFAETRRNIRSAFLGYSADFDSHLLQASARTDDNSQFGNRTTGNLHYGYRMTPEWRLSAGVGTAFKAPTFNDLYFVDPFFVGNPDLEPEKSRNYEAAINYDAGMQRAGLTFYHNRIRDLIANDFSVFPATVRNVNEARIRGATLHYGADLSSYAIRAEITHQDAEDEATGNELVRRARTFGALGVTKAAGGLRLGAEVVGSGRRFDDLDNMVRIGGYGLLNLHAAYALTSELTLAARWNNVFDKEYELARGFNTLGSNVFVSVEYSLK
ncbi:MAG: TonB-dependent receptor domain-containing protein [Burkholderiales bacterium]